MADVKIRVVSEDDASRNIGKAEQALSELDEQAIRSQIDLSKLDQTLEGWIRRIDAATPQNIKLASAAGAVTKAWQEGKISGEEARRKLEEIRKEMDKGGQKTESYGMKWTELYSQLMIVKTGLETVYRAVKKVYEAAQEGAEMEYAIGRFDRLSESIGTTSELLKRDLKDATRGMMTDFEMMASAADLMGLGLAKDHDEVVRLTRVASALNMDMNQLVLTLTNQTTMRFDQLNVAVDGFDERVARLKATGMSTNAAFQEAFLQQAEAQIERIGEKADSTVGAYEAFNNAIENNTDRFKQNLGEGLEPLVRGLTRYLLLIEDVERAAVKTSKTYESYTSSMNQSLQTQGRMLDSEGRLLDENMSVIESTEYLTRTQWEAVRAGEELDNQLSSESIRASEAGVKVEKLMYNTADYNTELDRANRYLDTNSKNLLVNIERENAAAEAAEKHAEALKLQLVDAGLDGKLQDAWDKYNESTDDGTEAQTKAKEAIKEAIKMLIWQETVAKLDADAQLILAEKLGLISEKDYELVDAIQKVNEAASSDAPHAHAAALDAIYKAALDGKITVEELAAAMDLLNGKTVNTYIRVNTLGSYYEGYDQPQMEAEGGPVSSGKPYIVGEKGPELFVPNQNGQIIPNHQVNSNNKNVYYNYNIHTNAGGNELLTYGGVGRGRAR